MTSVSSGIGVIGVATGIAARARDAGLATVLVHPPLSGDAAAYTPLRDALEHPRVVVLDLVPGAEIDRVLDVVSLALEPGDLVVDATGSWWCDTLRRGRRMRHRAIWYVDAAPAADGEGLLAGGDPDALEIVLPVLERLAPRVTPVGDPGAAHFTLMLAAARNAALNRLDDELRQLTEACPVPLSEAALAVLEASSAPRSSRRGAWLLDDAVRLEATVPLLAHALMLELGAALDEHRSEPPPPREGPFVDPASLA